MRLGVMLRTIDERQGTGVYTRNLMDRLVRLDTSNEYVLFYRDPAFLGRYAGFPRVTEKLVRAPGKAAWDQVMIPIHASRCGVDAIFHPKFTVPLFTGRKTAMTIHGASWFVHPELYPKRDIVYVKAVMPLYCRKADLIISNSELTTNDYIRILKVPHDKICTVPLGTNEEFRPIRDSNALDETRRKYGLPEKFILSVVRYDPRKNFGNLIAAFRLLRKRTPCKLVVTGIGCEKYRSDYDLDGDGTGADVLFLGWVNNENLPPIYNLAHCLFFPSVYEEFGIPACEAMACGIPPVVSNTGNLPAVVGNAGLTANPFSPEEMADALEKIWTDGSLRTELATRCLARARMFTWKRCAEETLAALNKLL